MIEQDSDNIEAGRGVVQSVFREPGEGGFADLPLLEGGHGELGDSVGEGSAAFYLDKDEGFAVFGDDVYFAPFAAEVALDDLHPVPFQKGRGQLFAAISQAEVLMAPAGGSLVFSRVFGFISPSHGST